VVSVPPPNRPTGRGLLRDTSWPALVTLGAVGGVFCVTPGLETPNYHGAFLLTLVAGLVGGLAGVSAGHDAARDVRGPARLALRRLLLPSLAPLGLLLLNGLRVQTCDLALGVAFHAVGPVFTTLWSGALGAWCGAPMARKLTGYAAFVAVWVGWIGLDLAHILTEPAIFSFNPFAGYFAGNLYDSVILLDGRYLGYRVANLIQLAAFGGLFALGWRRLEARWRVDPWHPPRSLPQAVAVLAAVGALAFWAARAPLGHQLDRQDIARRLGGKLEDDRLTLYYDRARIPEADARRLFEDHRFRLHQLEEALGERFPERISSWIYGDEHEKRLMMGAGRVYLAKPWLREIHLNRPAYGDPVILHELAHVVLGLYAPPPFHIPARMCLLPNMALVEGAAESFEWDTGALTPHQWTAAMRKAGLAPPLEALLGPAGFYLQSSSLAYTMAGSFIRHLRETRPLAAFKAAYGDGDFEAAYGAPLASLISEWEALIARQDVSSEAAEVAAARFAKRAIFFQVCGLDVARLEAEGWSAARSGDLAAAEAAFEQIITWTRGDSEKHLPLIELAARRGDVAAVTAQAARYFAIGERLALSDGRVIEWMGDASLRRGDFAGAQARYTEAARSPMPQERRRTLAVKAAIARAGEAGDTRRAGLARYLLGGDQAALAGGLEAVPGAPGADVLAVYLTGRRDYLEGRHVEAAARLDAVAVTLDAGGATDGPDGLKWVEAVRREALRLAAESLLAAAGADGAQREARLEGASERFGRAAALAPDAGDRERLRDWQARVEWLLKTHPDADAQLF
jgi:hypothetical protein